jgi:hypothetical protein
MIGIKHIDSLAGLFGSVYAISLHADGTVLLESPGKGVRALDPDHRHLNAVVNVERFVRALRALYGETAEAYLYSCGDTVLVGSDCRVRVFDALTSCVRHLRRSDLILIKGGRGRGSRGAGALGVRFSPPLTSQGRSPD